MKGQFYFTLIAVTLAVLTFARISQSQETGVKLSDDEKLQHNLQGNIAILQIENEDVFGSGSKQQIFLLGKRFDDKSLFITKLYLLIKNGREKGYVINFPEATGDGYEARMTIKDLTGDNVPEILVRANTGGSGGYINFNIFSAKDKKSDLIFDSNSKSVKISGHFLDNYRARITNTGNNKTHLINIFRRRAMYLKHKIYNKKCTLIKPVEIRGGAYNLLYPVDIDRDGVFELKGVIAVKGIANFDTVADLEIIWKWQDGGWVLINSKIAPYRD